MGVFTRALSGTVAFLIPALFVLLVPVPARAHDALVASAPEDGQSLGSAPEEVVLTFSGEVMDVSTAVLVLDSQAETVRTTDPVVRGRDVSVELSEGLADGGYAVRWRVVSGDGHPISGTFTFQIGEGGPPPPPLDAVPDQENEPDPGATGADPEPAAAGPVADPLPRTAVLALVGALGGLLLYLIALRLRQPRSTGDATTTTD